MTEQFMDSEKPAVDSVEARSKGSKLLIASGIVGLLAVAADGIWVVGDYSDAMVAANAAVTDEISSHSNSLPATEHAYPFLQAENSTYSLRFDYSGAFVQSVSKPYDIKIAGVNLTDTETRHPWPFTIHVTRTKQQKQSTVTSTVVIPRLATARPQLQDVQCGHPDKTGFVEDGDTLYVGEADFSYEGRQYALKGLKFPDTCTTQDNSADELFHGKATIIGVQYPIADK